MTKISLGGCSQVSVPSGPRWQPFAKSWLLLGGSEASEAPRPGATSRFCLKCPRLRLASPDQDVCVCASVRRQGSESTAPGGTNGLCRPMTGLHQVSPGCLWPALPPFVLQRSRSRESARSVLWGLQYCPNSLLATVWSTFFFSIIVKMV